MYSRWGIHHAEGAEVATGEGHQNPARTVHVIIADEDRQGPHLRLVVRQHEEGDESQTRHHWDPHPSWAGLQAGHT